METKQNPGTGPTASLFSHAPMRSLVQALFAAGLSVFVCIIVGLFNMADLPYLFIIVAVSAFIAGLFQARIGPR